ncbi:sugar ABC transporter ATP-binding protein [Aquibacillus koreensis]|uniref:Sugar ABC transporter ATP-binding protein n=1 Tax=Aquibacillus koreensis TaxID=279446 RepID=A0A9X3WIM9_9BACI|nr:sugar ABC transporter ATP-binding protein [Aquibacillus koreensis]MCT2534737.1 sugar ABC transporter ATP-binding protein [Aquibacillus koreensis]MDC3419653.1 sugar ABC transporter ATP-binding protein [Aquibacillus koreensis]
MDKPILIMEGITKEFPGVKALDGVDFELYPGEVHALMGENGAGKSTLMKILSGVYQHTAGKILLNEEEVTLNNPTVAQELGISIIHQEFNLFPNLSAAENIFIDRKEIISASGKINWSRMNAEAKALTESIGADIDVRREVQYLGVHSQQVIEIAKALSFNAKILIMDEPSAALPEDEVQKMFDVVKQLRNNGVAIVYVSHRMNEIFKIADKVTVLRDGGKVSTNKITETTEDQLISEMVGKEVGDLYPDKTKRIFNESVLNVNDFDITSKHKVSFSLRRGEILGFFGLVGSGTHTLAERIFGLKKGKGTVEINGKSILIKNPKDAMKQGIAYLPPDRHRQGLVKESSIRENMTLPILKRISNGLIIDKKAEQVINEEYIEKLSIKTPSQNQVVNLLSGGNQQKVVLAKWLTTKPDILIMEEPTRGVDVGAKAEIYRLINELSLSGLSIILISTEMPELIGMSDRILVMNEGNIVNEFKNGEADQQKLLKEASNSIDKMVV